MAHVRGFLRQFLGRSVLTASAMVALVAILLATSRGDATKAQLRIGISNPLRGDAGPREEKAAVKSLQSFIQDEIRMTNSIVQTKDWQELADSMAKGQLQVGVFQGYEFAWAQKKYPGLKLLALAVNVYRYPVAYAVVKRDNPIRDFAGLRGATLALPAGEPPFLKLFVERQCEANGKKMAAFFSKVSTPKSIEDGLDDVVDGIVTTIVVDRAALEAFKRRKSVRSKQLKEIARSEPIAPPVVAYQDGSLTEANVQRFRKGLLEASGKERATMMLNMSRLTGFEEVPEDFPKVLARTRKAYPPSGD
jgi:ABC-type phosphate/phosphonate transport system substrate-binding protein